MAVTLEIQHGINHMLQNSRSCDNSFFCHMSDNKNGDSHTFCDLHKYRSSFSYLRYTSRCGGNVFLIHRLDRINHYNFRLHTLDHPLDRLKAGLTEQQHFLSETSDSGRSQFNLLKRFFTRYIQYFFAFFCEIFADLQKNG